jgi:hypothetical protein
LKWASLSSLLDRHLERVTEEALLHRSPKRARVDGAAADYEDVPVVVELRDGGPGVMVTR